MAVPHHSPMMRVKKESSEKRTGGGLGSPRSGCGELCETGVICLCFRPNEAELSVLQKVFFFFFFFFNFIFSFFLVQYFF